MSKCNTKLSRNPSSNSTGEGKYPKINQHMRVLICLAAIVAVATAFMPTSSRLPRAESRVRTRSRLTVTAGPFDGLFGGDAAARRKEEDYQRQQEILRARQNPNEKKKYFSEVEKRRRSASEAIGQKFNLSKGGKQDPAVKWMELRKKGVIGEREKYEGQDTNSGLIIPQVPFGKAKYDEGQRFDLRLPYVDEGYVDPNASFGATVKRLFGFGKPSKPTTLPNDGRLDDSSPKGKKK